MVLTDLEDLFAVEVRHDLLPASNIRWRNIQVCATCKWWYEAGGFGLCIRPNGFECDVGDMAQWQTVCDRWAK